MSVWKDRVIAEKDYEVADQDQEMRRNKTEKIEQEKMEDIQANTDKAKIPGDEIEHIEYL